METEETGPNIFTAASNNDLAELQAALDAGQKLSDQEPVLHMTPLHIAAARHCNDFLAEAAKHESFDPWVRDLNERTAFDHAAAYNNRDGMKTLYDVMTAPLRELGDDHIDYSDNLPALD